MSDAQFRWPAALAHTLKFYSTEIWIWFWFGISLFAFESRQLQRVFEMNLKHLKGIFISAPTPARNMRFYSKHEKYCTNVEWLNKSYSVYTMCVCVFLLTLRFYAAIWAQNRIFVSGNTPHRWNKQYLWIWYCEHWEMHWLFFNWHCNIYSHVFKWFCTANIHMEMATGFHITTFIGLFLLFSTWIDL